MVKANIDKCDIQDSPKLSIFDKAFMRIPYGNNKIVTTIISSIILFIIFYLASKLSAFLPLISGTNVHIMWPVSGILVAFVLFLGYRSIPGVFFASFLIQSENLSLFYSHFSESVNFTSIACAIAFGRALESYVAAFIIRKFIRYPTNLSHWRDILILFAGVGMLSSLPYVIIKIFILFINGLMIYKDVFYYMLAWWVTNNIGIVIFTPILMILFAPTQYITQKRKIVTIFSLSAIFTIITLIFLNINHMKNKQIKKDFQNLALNVVLQIENKAHSDITLIDNLHYDNFPIDHLLGNIIDDIHKEGVEIEIFIRNNGKMRKKLFSSSKIYPSWQFINFSTIIAGTIWDIYFYQTDEYFFKKRKMYLWVLLLGGFVFTIIFAMLVMIITGYSDSIGKIIKETTENLRKAKEEAEAATKMKSDFLAIMSHEIRTPMNGIIGTTELALDTKLTARQQNYLKNVLYSAENLLEILNDILDFSKIEAGKMELEMLPFDLKAASLDVVNLMSPKARQKNLKITLNFNKDVPQYLVGDAMRIRQILHNLVSNAIKFTDKGNIEIIVDIKRDHKIQDGKAMIITSVKDDGIGMNTEQKRNVFNKFVQADSSTTRKFGGTGLGLTICQIFVNMLGGEIWVDSKPGKGSTFSFTMLLDISKKADIDSKHIFSKQDYLDNTLAKSVKILMAEDNRINAEFAKEMLEKLKCEVIVVPNGLEATKILEKDTNFDLIFMDCQMPIMDGFEATSVILKYEKANNKQHIPIIALTANAMKGDGEKCIKAGMDDYLTKPVRQKDFSMIIQKWLVNNNKKI